MIERRVEKGALIPEYRGVYRVGHRAPSREARYMAAVKACGAGALLCGRAAAHLWGLVKGSGAATSGGDSSPNVGSRGSTSMRCRGLEPTRTATRRAGIPVTTVPRTLVDLAAALPLDALARACHEAGSAAPSTTPRAGGTGAGAAPQQPRRREPARGSSRGDEKVDTQQARVLLHCPICARPGFRSHSRTSRPGTGASTAAGPSAASPLSSTATASTTPGYSWEQDYRREREARARGDEFRRYTYGRRLEDPRLHAGADLTERC